MDKHAVQNMLNIFEYIKNMKITEAFYKKRKNVNKFISM